MTGLELATWLQSVATLLAVLVALFKDELLGWWRRPQTRVRLLPEPPDSMKIMDRVKDEKTGALVDQGPAYFSRLWVHNEGKVRAEKVQVYLAAVSRKGADGMFHAVETFQPMNLKWSYSHEPIADGISPKMGRHCDFFHVWEPAYRERAKRSLSSLPEVPDAEALLELDEEYRPYTLGHILRKGEYRLTIKIVAANSFPSEHVVEIKFDGRWFDDERTMFREGVGIVAVV